MIHYLNSQLCCTLMFRDVGFELGLFLGFGGLRARGGVTIKGVINYLPKAPDANMFLLYKNCVFIIEVIGY